MSFAGVSVVGEVRPPQPASGTTAITYSGYHLLVVNGYSSLVKDIPNGEFRESRHFKVGGYRWTLQCYPDGYEPHHDGYMSFYLFLDQGNVVDPVMVQFEFSFLGYPVRAMGPLKFCSNDPYKFLCLKKRKNLEKSKYLKNDSFTVPISSVLPLASS